MPGEEESDDVVRAGVTEKSGEPVEQRSAGHLLVGQNEALHLAVATAMSGGAQSAGDLICIAIGKVQREGWFLIATDPNRQ